MKVNNYVPGRNDFTECHNGTINNSSMLNLVSLRSLTNVTVKQHKF